MLQQSERQFSQLAKLAERFPERYVEHKAGNDYIAHHIINQRLLSIVGPFDFELQEVFRGDVPAMPPNPRGNSQRAKAGSPALQNAAVGASYRLQCVIDGRQVTVTEVGDVGDPHNWPHDGARLKDAASDALKRCAMRLGLGLHVWAQQHYFLDTLLAAQQKAARDKPVPVRAGGEGPAQPQEDASPATLDAPGARPRPAPRRPMPEAGASSGAPMNPGMTLAPKSPIAVDPVLLAEDDPVDDEPRALPEEDPGPEDPIRLSPGHEEMIRLNPGPDREEMIKLGAAHRATVALEGYGGRDLNDPLKWQEAHAAEAAGIAGYLRDHPEAAEEAYAEALAARAQPVPGHEQTSTQDDTTPSTQDDGETGEVIPLQAWADKLCGGNMFQIAGHLRKVKPEWADHGVAWFNRLGGPDLDEANRLLRDYHPKPRTTARSGGEA
jgi:hypothetical protein